jgi:hypothetical protein
METNNENVQYLQYSPDILQLLQQELEISAENGNPVDYDVRIDGRIVIQRTNDPQEFSKLERLVNMTTQQIVLLRYLTSASRRNTKTIIRVNEKVRPAENHFAETDIELIVRQRMEKIQLQWQIDQLNEKLSNSNKLASEREDYINGLEKEIDELEKKLDELTTEKPKSERFTVLGLDVGEVLGKGLAGLIEKNPNILESFGLSGFADAIKKGKSQQTASTGTDIEIHPEHEADSEAEIVEETKHPASSSDEQLVTVPQQEYDMMMSIMNTLLAMNEHKKSFLQIMRKCAANNALIPVLANMAETMNTRSTSQNQ